MTYIINQITSYIKLNLLYICYILLDMLMIRHSVNVYIKGIRIINY